MASFLLSDTPIASPTDPLKPWQAKWWVRVFQSLGPGFPSPDASEESWEQFVAACSRGPFVLLGVGILVAIGVLCCSCLCKPPARTVRIRKPLCLWPIGLGILALLLIALGTIIYWRTGTVTWQNANRQLTRLHEDATTAREEGSRLRSSGQWLLADLDAIPSSCRGDAPGLPALRSDLSHFLNQTGRYWEDVDSIPGRVHSVQQLSDGISLVSRVGLLLPLLLIFVLPECDLGSVLHEPGPMQLALRTDPGWLCCLAASVRMWTPTHLLTLVTSLVLILWSTTSASTTSLSWPLWQGTNPLLQQLQEASDTVSSAQATIEEYGPAIKEACPQWRRADNLTQALVVAEESIDMAQRLLSLQNVYRFYNHVVRHDACQTAVIGLGWLILFQVVVGFIFLPWLVTISVYYLKSRRIWAAEQTDWLNPGFTPALQLRSAA